MSLQGLLVRTGRRVQRALEAFGTAIEQGARAAIAGARSGITALRESWEGITARRRALKERHQAHARHIVHIDEVTQPDDPAPYPLPPPLPELEEHEKLLRQQQAEAVELLPRRAVRLPDAPAGGRIALRERPTRRRAVPQLRPHKAHLPAPPAATRVRSALLLMVLMSALGAVVTAVFLGVLLLVVKALSGV